MESIRFRHVPKSYQTFQTHINDPLRSQQYTTLFETNPLFHPSTLSEQIEINVYEKLCIRNFWFWPHRTSSFPDLLRPFAHADNYKIKWPNNWTAVKPADTGMGLAYNFQPTLPKKQYTLFPQVKNVIHLLDRQIWQKRWRELCDRGESRQWRTYRKNVTSSNTTLESSKTEKPV